MTPGGGRRGIKWLAYGPRLKYPVGVILNNSQGGVSFWQTFLGVGSGERVVWPNRNFQLNTTIGKSYEKLWSEIVGAQHQQARRDLLCLSKHISPSEYQSYR